MATLSALNRSRTAPVVTRTYEARLEMRKKLQKLAEATRLSIEVCHFPSGTSKWNKGEHRLFSFISSNWRGEPLRDYETIVALDLGHDHRQGVSRILPPRPSQVSIRATSDGRGDEDDPHYPSGVSW